MNNSQKVININSCHSRVNGVMRFFDRHPAPPERPAFSEASPPRLRQMLRRGEKASYAQAGRLFIMLIGLLWFGVIVIRADTHYVSLVGTNDSVNGYITWSGAATNIQWAVNAASAATFDTVLVSNGTYNLTNQISIPAKITVRSLNGTNLTFVNGDNYVGKQVTNRCFYISNGILNGFTVSNGFVRDDSGGGIYVRDTGLVYNCFIYGNTASNISKGWDAGGGGVFISSGSIVSNCYIVNNTFWDSILRTRDVGGGGAFLYLDGILMDSYITENVSYWFDGGIHIDRNGTPAGECIVTNCVVANNFARSEVGGVSLNYGGVVANCVISNNTASTNIGGVRISAGMGIVKNSIIIGNTASNLTGGAEMSYSGILSNCQVIANRSVNSSRGGVYMSGSYGTPQVVNCTIACNRSMGTGGGIALDGGRGLIKNCLIYCNTNGQSLNGGGVSLGSQTREQYPNGLINCTIVSNRTNGRGGGVYAEGTNYIANCIIRDNWAGGTDGWGKDGGLDIYNDTAGNTNNYWNTCIRPNLCIGSGITNLPSAQGNITNNPLFIDQGNRNYRLRNGSPCINTGKNLLPWMAGDYDLDGLTRIRYGNVDMGAYEAIYGGTIYRFR